MAWVLSGCPTIRRDRMVSGMVVGKYCQDVTRSEALWRQGVCNERAEKGIA